MAGKAFGLFAKNRENYSRDWFAKEEHPADGDMTSLSSDAVSEDPEE